MQYCFCSFVRQTNTSPTKTLNSNCGHHCCVPFLCLRADVSEHTFTLQSLVLFSCKAKKVFLTAVCVCVDSCVGGCGHMIHRRFHSPFDFYCTSEACWVTGFTGLQMMKELTQHSSSEGKLPEMKEEITISLGLMCSILLV